MKIIKYSKDLSKFQCLFIDSFASSDNNNDADDPLADFDVQHIGANSTKGLPPADGCSLKSQDDNRSHPSQKHPFDIPSSSAAPAAEKSTAAAA